MGPFDYELLLHAIQLENFLQNCLTYLQKNFMNFFLSCNDVSCFVTVSFDEKKHLKFIWSRLISALDANVLPPTNVDKIDLLCKPKKTFDKILKGQFFNLIHLHKLDN